LKGLISNIERGSTLDGPGIRTVVFLKGCPLSCVWCHNPEAIRPWAQPVWESQRCEGCGRCVAACVAQALRLEADGIQFPGEACRTCPMPCVAACANGALRVCGEEMDVEQVLDAVERDAAFFTESGGGVTFSGGEPLAQADFVAELAQRCHAKGLHTALDTSLDAPWPTLARLLPWTDLLLCDLKLCDSAGHEALTGVPAERIHDNLRRADAAGCRIWIRRPVVPGVNDAPAEMEATAAFAAGLRNVERFELLPFNTLAALKYRSIGRRFGLAGVEAPTADHMECLQNMLRARGVPCGVGPAPIAATTGHKCPG
jgi:pyruvate formate lyase activating enzyme